MTYNKLSDYYKKNFQPKRFTRLCN